MFLQDEKGYWHNPNKEVQCDPDKEKERDPDKQRECDPDKETEKDSGSKKKKKRRKTTKIDDAPKSDSSVFIDPPIPPELQLPPPISDRTDEPPKMDDAPKSDASVIIDPPIPPELQLPTPISDRRDELLKMDDAPKSDTSVIIDPSIPPELQLPTPISDRTDEPTKSDVYVMVEHTREPISDRTEEPRKGDFYVMLENTREQQDPGPISDRTDEPPEGDVYHGSILDRISMTLIPDESHSLPQPPIHSDSILPPLPPPIPPLPVGYKTMTVKQLEKKHKHIQKEIAAQCKELEKLKNQKVHIEVCLDYFETDEQDFMCTLQGPSTPPEEEETASLGAKSESPSPSPPRPSFLEHLGTTLLSALPTEDIWSRSNHTHRNTPNPGGYSASGSTRQTEDDPLSEPFTLFGGGGTRSQSSPPR